MTDDVKYFMVELGKKYGKDSIKYGMQSKPKKSTGSVYFDYLLNGGFEEDSIALFFGPSQSGKTSMSLRNVAEAQKRGETCAWLRIEKGANKEYMEKLGVDTSKLIIIEKLEYGEQYLDVLLELINQKIDLIVVDSLSALVPKREQEEPMEKQQMGLQAALISKLLRKANAVNKKSIIIFISQIRMTFNSQGLTLYNYSGGTAAKHNSDYIVEFKLKEKLDDDQKEIGSSELKTENKREVTGANMTMYIEKSRRGVAHKMGEMYFSFKTGQIDELGELRKVACKLGLMSHAGGWDKLSPEFMKEFDIEKESIRYQDFKVLLSENPKMVTYLKDRIAEHYEK